MDVLHLETPEKQPGRPDDNVAFQLLADSVDVSREALIMGYDSSITYGKICLICFYLERGIPFLGTNPDKHTMINGSKIPGTGCLIKSVETVAGR